MISLLIEYARTLDWGYLYGLGNLFAAVVLGAAWFASAPDCTGGGSGDPQAAPEPRSCPRR